ncbi:sensor histidine kinase [Clostridium cellulovorans]|uniref:histidine kinase n=1 Tax=Clostridium cellulovorans (strain ATCC 35296 / DSM 3052 / OCM 3 / 743B) TaxID=573061 RepID=D9SPI2_CLOC7|nr:ATP-binding protein [Clostridium cellulovorans]ADL50031.1 multi-sensor signal transduction histidine kinase [Clostridium cellulovorans 743B]
MFKKSKLSKELGRNRLDRNFLKKGPKLIQRKKGNRINVLELNKNISLKITFGFLAIVIVSTLFIGIIAINIFKNNIYEIKENNMRKHAQAISETLEPYMKNPQSSNGLNEIMHLIYHIDNARIWVLNPNKTIVTASDKSNAITYVNDTEVNEVYKDINERVLLGEQGYILAYNPYYEEDMMTIAVPIKNDNKVIGAVVVNSPIYDLINSMDKFFIYIILILGIEIIIVGFMGYYFSNSISKPIRKINESALKLARGHYGIKTNIYQKDEIGELSSSFDLLSLKLEYTIGKLFEEKNKLSNIIKSISEGLLALDTDMKLIDINEAAIKLLGIDDKDAKQLLPISNENYEATEKLSEVNNISDEAVEKVSSINNANDDVAKKSPVINNANNDVDKKLSVINNASDEETEKLSAVKNSSATTKIEEPKEDSTKYHIEIMEIFQQLNLIEALGLKDIQEKKSVIKNFKNKILDFSIAPIRKSSNEIIGGVILIQDISEKEKLEQLRKDFISNVSHEFRTPLTVIKGNLESIVDGITRPEDVMETCINLIKETNRLERMVKDLLNLSKLESGTLELEVSDLDVNLLINDTIRSLRPLIRDKNIAIELSLQEDLSILQSDYYKLKQLLIIFIDNSIKFSSKGGVVKVDTYSKDKELYIAIKDNGIGIPQEEIQYLGEKFYKADKARNATVEGTGLGLSIAKRLVKVLNGTFKVESQVNQGTRIIISFPISKNSD